MLDNLGLVIASVCLVLGGVLLYGGFSKPDATQTLMIVGAVLVSLATVIIGLILKNKLEWKRNYKRHREG